MRARLQGRAVDVGALMDARVIVEGFSAVLLFAVPYVVYRVVRVVIRNIRGS